MIPLTSYVVIWYYNILCDTIMMVPDSKTSISSSWLFAQLHQAYMPVLRRWNSDDGSYKRAPEALKRYDTSDSEMLICDLFFMTYHDLPANLCLRKHRDWLINLSTKTFILGFKMFKLFLWWQWVHNYQQWVAWIQTKGGSCWSVSFKAAGVSCLGVTGNLFPDAVCSAGFV